MKYDELTNLEEIVYRRLSGLEINSLLTDTDISEQDIVDLIHEYDTRKITTEVTYDWSFPGGDSDWDGGGNPHRLMEEAQARKERKMDSFVEYCKKKEASPRYCEEAIKNAYRRITPEEPVESDSKDVAANSDAKEPAPKHDKKKTCKKCKGFLRKFLIDFFFKK